MIHATLIINYREFNIGYLLIICILIIFYVTVYSKRLNIANLYCGQNSILVDEKFRICVMLSVLSDCISDFAEIAFINQYRKETILS
jgi:hypothetical protein